MHPPQEKLSKDNIPGCRWWGSQEMQPQNPWELGPVAPCKACWAWIPQTHSNCHPLSPPRTPLPHCCTPAPASHHCLFSTSPQLGRILTAFWTGIPSSAGWASPAWHNQVPGKAPSWALAVFYQSIFTTTNSPSFRILGNSGLLGQSRIKQALCGTNKYTVQTCS